MRIGDVDDGELDRGRDVGHGAGVELDAGDCEEDEEYIVYRWDVDVGRSRHENSAYRVPVISNSSVVGGLDPAPRDPDHRRCPMSTVAGPMCIICPVCGLRGLHGVVWCPEHPMVGEYIEG